MMLAEMSAYDPPILIPAFLGCMMFLLVGTNYALDFWSKIQGRPTPGEVLEKARKEFVSRHEFNEFKKTIEDDLDRISAENQNILTAGSQRETHISSLIEALDSRIDELPDKMVERLTATMELLEQLKKKS
jgi:hypothetical protein